MDRKKGVRGSAMRKFTHTLHLGGLYCAHGACECRQRGYQFPAVLKKALCSVRIPTDSVSCWQDKQGEPCLTSLAKNKSMNDKHRRRVLYIQYTNQC